MVLMFIFMVFVFAFVLVYVGEGQEGVVDAHGFAYTYIQFLVKSNQSPRQAAIN